MEAVKETGHEEQAGEGRGRQDLGVFRAGESKKPQTVGPEFEYQPELGEYRVQKNIENLGDGWRKDIKSLKDLECGEVNLERRR